MPEPYMTDDPMADEEEAPDEELDDFSAAISEAFPDQTWDEDRLAAMKEAIRICVEKDQAGGYGEKPKEKGGLALIFGPKPKK